MTKKGILLKEEVGFKPQIKKEVKTGGNKNGIQKKEKQFKKR